VGKPFFGFSMAPSVSTTLFAGGICVTLLTSKRSQKKTPQVSATWGKNPRASTNFD
jgi:hypothetical protein